MLIGLNVSIILISEFFILLYLLYILRWKKNDVIRFRRLLNSVELIKSTADIKQIVFVKVDFNSKIPYVNDRYVIYDVAADGTVTLNTSITDIPLPQEFYYDYATSQFMARTRQNFLAVERLADKKLKYSKIGISEINATFPFYYQRRIGPLIDTEYKIVAQNPCIGNEKRKLPLLRREYYKDINIRNVGHGEDLLLSGYKECSTEQNYVVRKCPLNQYFNIAIEDCTQFDPNAKIKLNTQTDIENLMRRSLKDQVSTIFKELDDESKRNEQSSTPST